VRKPTKSLPDTNTIIRYLINDNTDLFARSNDFFEKVKNGDTRAVILESVIAECVYVLIKIYRVPKDKAAGRLIDILRYRGVVNQDRQELIRALSLFVEKNLDIVDCIIYTKGAAGGDKIFTLDQDLDKLAKKERNDG
jgi:predicted nucleic acid-binding protein